MCEMTEHILCVVGGGSKWWWVWVCMVYWLYVYVYGVLVVYSCICIGVSNRVGASGLGIG